MIKQVIFLILIFFCVSCNTTKPIITTTKKVATKPKEIIEPKQEQVVIKKEVDKPISESKTEILEATSKVKVTTEIVLQYIDKYKNISMENMSIHGIPASIALAQAILESGAGTGSLSKNANNHFGIKCHKEWQGESVKHDDDELQECFRKYSTVLDSYQDYANFLKTRRWYEPLFKLSKDDYKGWAHGLKKAGYATDPKYPSKLIGIIERYQLQKYDAQVLGKEFIEEKLVLNTEATSIPKPNTTNFHQVTKGDTLYSISKKYNISIEDLKLKNKINDSNAIAIGKLLEIK